MKVLRIGIAPSYEALKERTLRIARGDLKPEPDDPKVWFASTEAFAKVLSDRNQALLALIREERPTSLEELARLSARAKPNLSRTLKTMEGYGLVKLHRGPRNSVIPEVPFDRITLDLPLGRAA
ncbi:MAG TPA: MarR family transcriptional regulator [Azospirillaceae bacterium]|nr:MarR family transcriptional regulator [Azospirillaceae bacterium]